MEVREKTRRALADMLKSMPSKQASAPSALVAVTGNNNTVALGDLRIAAPAALRRRAKRGRG